MAATSAQRTRRMIPACVPRHHSFFPLPIVLHMPGWGLAAGWDAVAQALPGAVDAVACAFDGVAREMVTRMVTAFDRPRLCPC